MSTLVVVQRMLANDVGIVIVLLGYIAHHADVDARWRPEQDGQGGRDHRAARVHVAREQMSTFVANQRMLANDVGIINLRLGYMSLGKHMDEQMWSKSTLASDVGISLLLGYMSLVAQMPWPASSSC